MVFRIEIFQSFFLGIKLFSYLASFFLYIEKKAKAKPFIILGKLYVRECIDTYIYLIYNNFNKIETFLIEKDTLLMKGIVFNEFRYFI